jgi:hypothetical protein
MVFSRIPDPKHDKKFIDEFGTLFLKIKIFSSSPLGLQYQCCGSGSAWIQNFCWIRIRNARIPDQDPGPYPKMDVNIIINHKKEVSGNFTILTILI